jgi:hypothetical protein
LHRILLDQLNIYFVDMEKYLFKNIQIVNEGKIEVLDLLTDGERIEKIGHQLNCKGGVTEINGEGKFLLPGVIDDQVHFREPGLTHTKPPFIQRAKPLWQVVLPVLWKCPIRFPML